MDERRARQGRLGRTWPRGIAIVVAWTFAGAAFGTPTWRPAFDVSTPTTATLAVAGTAASDDGTAVTVWTRGGRFVEASVRTPGGMFGPPELLSDAGRTALAGALAMDATGTAVAAWTEVIAGVTRVRAATRQPGASAFDAAQTLSASSSSAAHVSASVAQGNVVVAWSRPQGASRVVELSLKPRGAALFGVTDVVSPSVHSATDTAVGIAPSGEVVVTWVSTRGVAPNRFQTVSSAVRRPDGTITPYEEVGTAFAIDVVAPAVAPFIRQMKLVMDPVGRATVAWSHFNGAFDVLQASRRGTTGQFGAVDDITSRTTDSGVFGAFDIALDGQDGAVAVWKDALIRAAVRPPGGVFGDPVVISGLGQLSLATAPPAVAVDAAGTATAAWGVFQGTTRTIYAARRPIGGAFSTPTEVDTNAGAAGVTVYAPSLAVDGDGDATQVYVRAGTTPTPSVIRAAGLDVAGPRLTDVNIPTTGVALQPLSFAVKPLDDWSAYTTSWDFGDSQSAAGDAVSHAYKADGSYRVQVTATDAVGNVRSLTRTIVVTAAPPPPGRIDGRLSMRSQRTTGGLRVRLLAVSRLPRDARVVVRCTGVTRRCPFTLTKAAQPVRGRVDLTKLLKRPREYRVGVTLEVRATAPGKIGQVIRIRVRAKAPRISDWCLPLGSSIPRRRC